MPSKSFGCWRSGRCSRSVAAGWRLVDCWATCCICFFCCFFSSFLSSKSFSLELDLRRSLSLSFDDCLWLFESLRVAPRSAEELPEFTTATRSRLDADADDFIPTECAGEIWWVCFDDPDDVEDGLPPCPLRNNDFNFIISIHDVFLVPQENISTRFFSSQFNVFFSFRQLW